MIITWCECCGYGMAVDSKRQKRCKYCRDRKPLQKPCRHWLPERGAFKGSSSAGLEHAESSKKIASGTGR